MGVRSALALLWRRLSGTDSLVRRRIGNHTLYLDPQDSGLSAALMGMRPGGVEREAAFMKILRRELEEGMTAVDLGANIGHVTLVMAEQVGPSGRVYAIEPHPRNYEILVKNVAENGYSAYVSTYHLGISNVTARAELHVSDASNLHSLSPTHNTTSSIEIAASTFDDFMKDKVPPSFIKMDIEGHEVQALEGMHDTLRSAVPPVRILMEVHPMFYSEEHSLERQLRRLLDIGFTTKYVISAGIPRPDFFVEHGYEPSEIVNTGRWDRGIYTDVSDEHMLISACHQHDQYIEHAEIHVTKIVRAVMVEKSVRARPDTWQQGRARID
jgi:FkbM family methyltransferase